MVTLLLDAVADEVNAVCFVDPAFSPHLLVTGSDDTMIKVWDRRVLPAHSAGSGDDAGMAKASGYLPGHHGGLTSLEARGDGRYILSNSKDQTAKLWDIRMMVPHTTHAAAYSDGGRSGRTWDYRGQSYP